MDEKIYFFTKNDLPTPHRGQTQEESIFSNKVFFGMLWASSPNSSLYTYPHLVQTHSAMSVNKHC